LALSNITVKFLPANTTHLQSLDGRIIQAFKLRYHQKLMEYILAHVDTCTSGTALAKQITAVKWCGKAWQNVPSRNVFKIVALSGVELEVVMQGMRTMRQLKQKVVVNFWQQLKQVVFLLT